MVTLHLRTIAFVLTVFTVRSNFVADKYPLETNSLVSISKASDTHTITAIEESLQELSKCMAMYLEKSSPRPFVTLTYAQSLDGKIAIVRSDEEDKSHRYPSSNFAISSHESMILTHALRSMHDAILVGGRTLAIDNPRLNNRLWKQDHHQPRPVVLDSTLQYVSLLGNDLRAQNNLIVCCTKDAAESYEQRTRYIKEDFSLTLLPCQTQENGQLLDLYDVLRQLKARFGIKSVMVEGGASVITSFVRERLVDFQCVTISPKLLGDAGLSSVGHISAVDGSDCIEIGPFKSICLGPDCVVYSEWMHQC
jgi:diaminohydroxyphosphoribosylaminopyrimidine deaminase / 5-amino-6-(5-phosphoribosylamino)uracil reductase